jgi:hypothetical protein
LIVLISLMRQQILTARLTSQSVKDHYSFHIAPTW